MGAAGTGAASMWHRLAKHGQLWSSCPACRNEHGLQDNPVRLADGTPNEMIPLEDHPDYPGMKFRSNPAQVHRGRFSDEITVKYELMLHHYMSRSMEDFINRKLIRPTGGQSARYASNGEDPWDPAVMRKHEQRIGMIGDAEVCKAVAAGTIVERCCSSDE
jgi:hypothetical protein